MTGIETNAAINAAIKAGIGGLIKKIFDESKPFFQSINDSAKQAFKIGLNKYLDNKIEQYSQLKTLLKGNTPTYIYSIYYQLKLKNDDGLIETNNIANLFENNNAITIIGDAGSGKSTLVKHLFLDAIKRNYAIPVLVELRYLNNKENSLQDYIKTKVLDNSIAENPKLLEKLFEKGEFVFFLDGYDELNTEIKSDVIKSLLEFRNKYSDNKFILTTRPYSNVEQLQNFHNYFVKELSFEDGEIAGFIESQLRDEKELSNKIIDSITENKSEHINSFLTNPLLLSLYILTFQSNADIPAKKHIFYRRVIQALFAEHDSKTKVGFIREKHSGLTQEKFEEILEIFCYLSYFDGKFSWQEDYIFNKFKLIKESTEIEFINQEILTDLKSAFAIWVEDNGLYSFAHRSLQEYFASLFVKNLIDKSKEEVYKKILNQFTESQDSREINNFLSLLEEMDLLNFKKLYHLPLLRQIEKLLIFENDKELYAKFIKLSFKEIRLDKDSDIVTTKKTANIQKVLYFDVASICSLHEILFDKVEETPTNELVALGNKGFEFEVWEFSLESSLPQTFIDSTYNDVLALAKEFHKKLVQEIKETEAFIEKSEKRDMSLANLI